MLARARALLSRFPDPRATTHASHAAVPAALRSNTACSLQLAHPTTAMSFRQLLPFTRNRPLSQQSPITIQPPPCVNHTHHCPYPAMNASLRWFSEQHTTLLQDKEKKKVLPPPCLPSPRTPLVLLFYGDRPS